MRRKTALTDGCAGVARDHRLREAGNVNSGAFDPIAAICDMAREHGAWVHVDLRIEPRTTARQAAGG